MTAALAWHTVARMSIRTLRADEPVPAGDPARYLDGRGYVRLRWHVGPDQYVEEYEHRIVAGRPSGSVHHVNGVKDDNRQDNLVVLTRAAHQRLHADQDRAAGRFRGSTRLRDRAARRAERAARWAEIASRYAAGETTTTLGPAYGVDPSNISRGLRARGVTMRVGRPGPR